MPLQELTPEQRSQRARIGGLSRWAREDPKPAMAKARAGFDQRFIDEVDPERVLSEQERNRRADAARRAYFSKLALKSARARAKKAS
jgi:predicted methyltransferase MtxX (methanogen marker protein 4)